MSRRALFFAFLKIGMLGFGGVAGWVRPILVEEYRFFDEREFIEWLGVASVLPGANTVNLAVMLGDRFRGISGALAALFGLLVAPLLILIGVASLYDHIAAFPDMTSAVGGAAAATAGLVLANALKMARVIRADILAILVAVSTFVAIGVLHMPLAATLAIVLPTSLVAFILSKRGH